MAALLMVKHKVNSKQGDTAAKSARYVEAFPLQKAFCFVSVNLLKSHCIKHTTFFNSWVNDQVNITLLHASLAAITKTTTNADLR